MLSENASPPSPATGGFFLTSRVRLGTVARCFIEAIGRPIDVRRSFPPLGVISMHVQTPDVIAYARLAFGVVLDQHEIVILPDRVATVPMADGAIGLIYETAECSATGSFAGNPSDGSLRLEHVRTSVWEADFGTIDRFRGARPDGTPILVVPSS